MKSRITVLGAGRMGSALVRAFLTAGFSVTVWNRTASRAAPLEAYGARVARSVLEAIRSADLVVGNLADYQVTDAALGVADVQGALSGRPFVELASGTPAQARARAEWAQANDIPYLDGAIMATPDFIGQPGCTLLYSGPRDLFDAHLETLRVLGGNTTFVGGDIGHANAADNALLVVLWGALLGTLQGAAICEAEGFPLSAFGQALAGVYPVLEGGLTGAVARIGQKHFTADETTASTVDICHASVHHILRISREHRLDLGLPEALDRVFQRAVDAGHARDDFAAVYVGLR